MIRLARDSSASTSIVGLAIWFGILTGLAEVLVLAIQKFLFGRILWRGLDAAWLIPITNIVMFAVVGLLFDGCARLWPRVFVRRFGVFILAGLSGFAVLFLFYPQLHKYAAMTLAVGLAVEWSRRITSSAGFDVTRRKSLKGMLVVVAGLAAGIRGSEAAKERAAIRRLPPKGAAAPNVLLIVLDTVRTLNLGLHGYGRDTTPRLERWIGGGVRFNRAMATAPWTLPSHATLFTGFLPHQLSTDWLVPLDSGPPTLAEFYSSQGYLTAGFVANTGYCSREFGLHRGFAHYEDYSNSVGQMIGYTSLGRYVTDSRRLRRLTGQHEILGRTSASGLTENFLNWLDGDGRSGRPFFAFMNYYDAHAPYLPPQPFAGMFGTYPPKQHSPLAHARNVAPEDVVSMVARYDASIAYVDHQLGVLFQALEERGLRENTLVVVCSDHGEEFGEHNFFDHGNSLYRQSLQVPLLMTLPGAVPAGAVIDAPVSLRDVPRTLVQLTHGGEASHFPGRSLARTWRGSAEKTPDDGAGAGGALVSEVRVARNVPEWLPVQKGNMHSLISEGWRYIRNGDGRAELYDFDRDPLETSDVSDTEAGRRIIARLSTELDEVLSR